MSEVYPPAKVEFRYLPAINFAMQQNRASLIRTLTIENTTSEALKDINIQLSADPCFATAVPYEVGVIPAGGTVRADAFKLNLETSFFAQLTERMAGSFLLEVFSGNVSLFRQTYPVDVLAFDEWGGGQVLPEMLAAFITPNHPAIQPLIKRASVILEKWTGNSALDAYQSRNPDRVRKQMAAIYAAISEQCIVYATAPASFEACGQRVRLADDLLSQKLGNCLDMTLLYTACLEAAGIHPLVILTEGHAFAGAWLTPETFPDSTIDDVSFLTKRMADGIHEIELVEATCMNQGNDADFDLAVQSARSRLKNPDQFSLAIDVKRTRLAGIRPLPQRIRNGEQWDLHYDESENAPDRSDMKPGSINPYDLSGINEDIPVTKQLMWERKLLDLSLRNNLLNIRITKNTLQLISADLDRFEDALANGDEFRIMPRPADFESPSYEFGLYQAPEASHPGFSLIRSELVQKRLHSYLSELELGRALQHLYRVSRLSIEENGANTLYIALGLMKWYETPGSERPRYAPVLLLPVEIMRKSAAKGYVIRSREEDTMMNITLLEMLRQNFGITIPGLDPLPVDDSGVNVKLIFSIIRNAIKDQRKWDIEEQGILGIFSFNKFIMWNDIHNNVKKLAENKIVSSLINGRLEWEVRDDMTDATVLDRDMGPADISLPISADSSQLEAVFEAMNDKSFILHGPPGTGKSQTITNIISNALYQGKRVLFVAEKMAALSVVQSRLQAIGLAPFCLELHSNKTKKSDVLAQLKATTEVLKKASPEEFTQQASRLHALRTELNTYVETLHKKYPFGLSMYDAITRFLALEGTIEAKFPTALLNTLTSDLLLNWHDVVDNLVSVGDACGHPHHHPLDGIRITSYSAAQKEEAIQLIRDTIDTLAQLKSRTGFLSSMLGVPDAPLDRKSLTTAASMSQVLLRIPELTPELLKLPRLSEALEEFQIATGHGKEKEALKKQLLTRFTEEVLTVDAKPLFAEWVKCDSQWFLPRLLGQSKIKKQLRPHTLGRSLNTTETKGWLSLLVKYRNEAGFVDEVADQLPALFGKFGKKNFQDWEKIELIIDDTFRLNDLIRSFANDPTRMGSIKEALARQLSDGIQAFRNIHSTSLEEFDHLYTDFGKKETALSTLLVLQPGVLCDASAEWIEHSTNRLQQWLTHIDQLKDWFQWLQVCQQLDKLQLGFVHRSYKEMNIPTNQLAACFDKSFCHACIDYIISREPTLELFKGQLFNNVIQKYKEIAARFEQLTKAELYAKLASSIPAFTQEAAQNSEVGILQKNIRNNARGTSLRKLFDQIPVLLPRLCPCMLMSPISVAQYIDPDAEKFDLIVFDEASQLPTYEAIGALARGKNVVIVGDPKQMPPTSFFATANVDEENIDMEDLDSILDDCLALSMPSKHLLWHYRSKHESLIAFSNAEYYDNKLLTFPSPDNIESKVRLIPIQGFYDKGKSRQNKAEAQAVVDEIARRLSDPVLCKRSIGVVTFSVVQQGLIEDLLSDLFVLRPDLETIALECEEPLFIKNLENVQGDERDIILFSVGYGPDQNGRVSMNFGPLNRVGGERRLNVAVSRARYEMLIFSTLRADQIDMNRSSAVGVAGLKRFLEYAEKGQRSLIDTQAATDTSYTIEDTIARRLRRRGHEVHTDIGCSGYRVDIGIVDPEEPTRYLLGIQCDGRNYYQTKTARDREIVHQQVLRLLGWNLSRVWTMDWWEKPEKVLDAIERDIKGAKKPVAQKTAPIINSYTPPPAPLRTTPATQPIVEEVSCGQPYHAATLLPIGCPSSDVFLYAENKRKIMSHIKQVVETEAPISHNLLRKRVLSAWGLSRGSRIEAHLEMILGSMPFYRTKHHDRVILWTSEEECRQYSVYRIGGGRDAAELPPEEVANALHQILKQQISIPVKDLGKLASHVFGFAKTGANIDMAMNQGMEEAVRKGYMKEDNGKMVITH